MELEKSAVTNTWNDLQSLQKETEILLETIRQGPHKKSNKNAASNNTPKEKKGSKQKQNKNESMVTTQKSRKTKRPKPNNLSVSFDSNFDKTTNLFSQSRVTVEVLDDASPDTTPRLDYDIANEKERAIAFQKETQRIQNVRTIEKDFRNIHFMPEKFRVLNQHDTFVPAPGITVDDVEKEKRRLQRLEESARERQRLFNEQINERVEFLGKDKSAVKLQSLFRGHIGRQKFALNKRLQELSDGNIGDWIEVRDRESGDVWYYNKSSGESQWERPDDMFSSLATKSELKTLPSLSRDLYSPSKTNSMRNSQSLKKGQNEDNNKVLLSKSMTLPSLAATIVGKNSYVRDTDPKDIEAKAEVQKMLGLDKLTPTSNLMAPDGSFKPQLRTTVMNALLETRFDSVSSVLADNRWIEAEVDQFAKKKTFSSSQNESRVNPLRKPMISMVRLDEDNVRPGHQITVKNPQNSNSNTTDKFNPKSLEQYTVKDPGHPGLGLNSDLNDGDVNGLQQEQQEGSDAMSSMCFGCWSSGARRGCAMHDDGSKLKPSETMLLCRNWDLSVMKRRYRSEEIQEIFLKSGPSLRYDPKRKLFSTVEEQRHIIYRYFKSTINRYNSRFNLFMAIKRWLVSFAEVFRLGKAKKNKGTEASRFMRLRRTLMNDLHVKKYTRRIAEFIPLPPMTGSTWPERLGEEQYLYTVHDPSTERDVEVIMILPKPTSSHLLKPRVYHLPVPKTIPMPRPDYNKDDLMNVMPVNIYLDEYHPVGWLEKLISSHVKESISSALLQVSAVTPLAGLEKLKRTKHPLTNTIKFATAGRKPTPGFMDVGGLPMELLIYQLVTTFIPSQYGNLMVMDKGVVSPGVSAEVMVSFQSLILPPVKLDFILRPLEHPLNYRRCPAIGVHTKVGPHDKHFYGLNRSEQTGEQESHGFRTTTWSKELLVYEETDPQSFMPGAEIASLNSPSVNLPKTTHADLSYPFCEPSTRDNSTLDFYHLLLYSVVSAAKSQIFTVLTVQEPGKFLKDSRLDLPLGHLVASIYRSWAFSQKDLIEEYKTDEGISYWYHRRTGQTFWERPLYEEEEANTLAGGTMLDMTHDESPTVGHVGKEYANFKYNQGQVRKQMLAHHESDAEAVRRRTAAAAAAKVGRQRGAFPDPNSIQDQSQNQSDLVPYEGMSDPRLARDGTAPTFGGGGGHHNNNHENDDRSLNSSQSSQQSNPMRPPNTAQSNFQPSSSMGNNQLGFNRPQSNHIPNVNNNNLAVPLGFENLMPGVNANMMLNISQSIGKLMSTMMEANPEDMVQLGLGMGMALMQTGGVPGFVGGVVDGNNKTSSNAGLKQLNNNNNEDNDSKASSSAAGSHGYNGTNEPIGVPHRTMIFSSNKKLEHGESEAQIAETALMAKKELTSMEKARAIVVEVTPTATPDVAPKKVLTNELPINADAANREKVPVLVYPELSSRPDGGPVQEYFTHPSAGVGTSFVLEKDRESQAVVPGSNSILRRVVMPLPVGFFDAITTSHVAGQHVDYLPQVPNLPQARTVGRVKPRSTALDWLSIAFDPWSAGKSPLNAEFVNSLTAKADKLFGKGGNVLQAQEEIENLRQATTSDAFANVDDKEGALQQRADITKAQVLATDFKKACSLCRHNKYSDIEQLLNQPDWNVPIDYQDDLGNSLLHIASQNGNKRLVKLCLRRGASLDLANLQGQTALHYAFGYGYADVGEYLVKKGCNDSVRNKDGLTCYEGLGARELSHL